MFKLSPAKPPSVKGPITLTYSTMANDDERRTECAGYGAEFWLGLCTLWPTAPPGE